MNLSPDLTEEQIRKIKKDKLKNKYKQPTNENTNSEYDGCIFGYKLSELDNLKDMDMLFNKILTVKNIKLRLSLLNTLRTEVIKKKLMSKQVTKVYFSV